MIKKILVSQPRPQSEHNPYADLEKRFGVECDFCPLISIEGLNAQEFRLQRINPLDYTAVLFNSRLAIDHFFRVCEEMRLSIPDTMHYYCISEAVGNYLQKYIQYRKRKVFFSENNQFLDLLPAMNRRPQERYMMVMSDLHNKDVINMFAEHKITITPAVMYRTVPATWPKDKPFDYDLVVLFTPTGVTAIHKNFPKLKPDECQFACFGANTQQALEKIGLPVSIAAPTPQYPSITAAIAKYLEENA